MKRIRVALAIMAAATFIVTGCGGGGGGGGGGDNTVTTSLQGRVLDPYGTPVEGASVSSTGGTKAAATTNSLGMYTLAGVPVDTSITITITKSGFTTKTLTGVVIDGATAGSSADMDIVMASDAPPANSTIRIVPYYSSQSVAVYLDVPQYFRIEVKNSSGTVIYPSVASAWTPTIIITGAAYGAIGAGTDDYDPTLFWVTGTTVNQQVKITALLQRADGTLATYTVSTTVQSTDMPPPPPI